MLFYVDMSVTFLINKNMTKQTSRSSSNSFINFFKKLKGFFSSPNPQEQVSSVSPDVSDEVADAISEEKNIKKDKLITGNTNSPKHIKPMKIIEYTSARLTFKKDEIEPLRDHDIIRIHVTNDSTTYEMTKKGFYRVFSNVVSSKSYTEIGNYNYKKTPQKALQFMVS